MDGFVSPRGVGKDGFVSPRGGTEMDGDVSIFAFWKQMRII